MASSQQPDLFQADEQSDLFDEDFSTPEYRSGVWGVTAFLAVAILFFWFHSRHHLVAQAPEEENALLNEAQKELAH